MTLHDTLKSMKKKKHFLKSSLKFIQEGQQQQKIPNIPE